MQTGGLRLTSRGPFLFCCTVKRRLETPSPQKESAQRVAQLASSCVRSTGNRTLAFCRQNRLNSGNGVFDKFLVLRTQLEASWATRVCATLGRCFGDTDLIAPLLNLFPNDVANLADALQTLFVSAGQCRRIGKAPMNPLRDAWEDRASLRTGTIADRDDVGEKLSAAEHVEDAFRRVGGNVEADLLHRLNHERVQRSRFQPSAVRLENLWASSVEKRLSHLATSTVVDANEKDFFHGVAYVTRPGLRLRACLNETEMRFDFLKLLDGFDTSPKKRGVATLLKEKHRDAV